MTRESAELTEDQQERRRAFFRRHWTEGVAFNGTLGIRVLRWNADGVELELPYSDAFSAHDGVLHGGAVAALIDTAGAGAVLAGHDFNKGSRLTTVSLTVNYLAAATEPGAVAAARCTRRGRTTHHAEVTVRQSGGDQVVAQALGVYNVTGQRPGLVEALGSSDAEDEREASDR